MVDALPATVFVTSMPPDVITFVPDSVTVFAPAALNRKLLVVEPEAGALLVVTVVLLPAAQVSLAYVLNATIVPLPLFAPQFAPATVAQPPKMELLFVVVVVTVPVAVGRVMFIVPPMLRVSAPNAVVPVLLVATMAEAPLLSMVPLEAKFAPNAALPTVSVPPPSCKLVDARVPVAPSVIPPLLMVVEPV